MLTRNTDAMLMSTSETVMAKSSGYQGGKCNPFDLGCWSGFISIQQQPAYLSSAACAHTSAAECHLPQQLLASQIVELAPAPSRKRPAELYLLPQLAQKQQRCTAWAQSPHHPAACDADGPQFSLPSSAIDSFSSQPWNLVSPDQPVPCAPDCWSATSTSSCRHAPPLSAQAQAHAQAAPCRLPEQRPLHQYTTATIAPHMTGQPHRAQQLSNPWLAAAVAAPSAIDAPHLHAPLHRHHHRPPVQGFHAASRQQPRSIWEPSPPGSACSASSCWPSLLETSSHAEDCCSRPTPLQQQQQQEQHSQLQYHHQQQEQLQYHQHQQQQQAMQPFHPSLQPTAHPRVTQQLVSHRTQVPSSPVWYTDINSPAALQQANNLLSSLQLPGGVEFMRVAPCSTLHRLGVLCNVSAASICLAQSYYQRLVLAMPALQSALFLLSTSPSTHSQGCVDIPPGVPSSPLQQAEAVTTSIKVTCVALAAKMLEPRSGQHKQLRGLLAYLAASHVSASEAVAIEGRVLHHLDWRLGPYFAPAELTAW